MKRIEDERIITEKRRINSNAFGICFLTLWLILIFRQFVLQQDIMEYVDIFLLTIGLSIYITISNVSNGLYLTYRNKQERKKVNLIGALVGSASFIIVQFFIMKYNLANWRDIIKLAVSYITFFLVWIIVQSALFNINERKANEEADDNG